MKEQELRKKFVDVMAGWIGIKEGSTGHKDILNIYNAIKPLPRGYKMTTKDSWCAATVSAAASVAGILSIVPAECSCTKMIEGFQKLGTWVEDDHYIPESGDIIFYDWEDNGKGDNRGAVDHVGVVYDVTNGLIIVIEGNKGGKPDCVGKRAIVVNGKYIRGYGVPNYASLAETDGERIMKLIRNDGIVSDFDYWRDVIDGKIIASGNNVRHLLENCHSQLLSLTKTVGDKTILQVVGDGVVTSDQYWADVVNGKTKVSAKNIVSLIVRYHDAIVAAK